MQNNLDSVVDFVKSYYIENNKPIPNSVIEYINDYPKGYSRQAIQTNLGLKTSEFVKLLNPTYEKALDAGSRALVECERLGYTLITDPKSLKHNRNSVVVECKDCGYIHTTTITSLAGSKLGCPKCKSGNLPWSKRLEELSQICKDRLESEVVSEVPTNQAGFISLKHTCGTVYETQLVGIVSPNTKMRATCPNCRPTDRRVVLDGITFGSQFEADCYTVLKSHNPELHVSYSDYFNTPRRWVCDFKIGKYWIEVSNFKQDYKNYFSNIEEKQALVESNDEYFFFVRSLSELKELVTLM